MFLVGFAIVILVVFVLTGWWYYIFYSYRKYLKAFPLLEQLPLIGITYKLFSTVGIYDIILGSSMASRNMYGMLGFFPILCTSDSEIFSLILKSPKCINKPALYDILKRAIDKSLLIVNGNEWRHQRKLLNPALDYSNAVRNIPIFNDQSDALVKALAEEVNKESTGLDGFIEYWSLIQSYEIVLGGDLTSRNRLHCLEALKCVSRIVVERMIRINQYFNITYVFSRNYWLERKCLNTISTYLADVLESRKMELNSEHFQKDKPILIDILLKQMKTDENITEAFIKRQLTLMISAGFDTTAMSVCFALYHLAKFPEIQERAYEEVFSILRDDINQSITHQHVIEMTYLDLVIKESMRLKTTVPMFMRKLDEDLDYGGTILPKGLTVILMSQAMHLDPELYPNPEKFIPERFLPENVNKNKYSYVPFCGGVRNCIGQRHAMLAMKIALAKVLLNYKLVEVNHELCLSYQIIIRSKTGIRVGLRRRN